MSMASRPVRARDTGPLVLAVDGRTSRRCWQGSGHHSPAVAVTWSLASLSARWEQRLSHRFRRSLLFKFDFIILFFQAKNLNTKVQENQYLF